MVLFLFGNVIYVFLLLWLCILIVCLCMTTLTEVFPCFFLSCKANARVKPAKTGNGPHSSQFLCCSMYICAVLRIVCFASFSVLFVCICALYYCHRVATQLQLDISYHFSSVQRSDSLNLMASNITLTEIKLEGCKTVQNIKIRTAVSVERNSDCS